MIVDQFPELAKLGPDEQLQLAGELAKQAMSSSDSAEVTPEAVELLEARLDHFLDHPETGVSWEELREQRKPGNA